MLTDFILRCGFMVLVYYTNAFGKNTVYPLDLTAIIMVLNSAISVNKTMEDRNNMS